MILRRGRGARLAVVAAAWLLAFAGPRIDAARADPIELQTTRVTLQPNAPAQQEVGALRYRGGLVLSSSDPRFGGLSGLLVGPDGGRVLAVSDEAYWVTFHLDYRDGDLVGAHNAEIWPMLDLAGQSMRGKAGDAESLAPLSAHGMEGDVAVGFERNHRIWRYSLGRDPGAAVPRVVPTPPDLKGMDRNGGLEGMTRLPDGRLLAISETTKDAAGNLIGWIIGPKGSVHLTLRRRDNFNLSDLSILPDGDVVTLERKLVMPMGLFMRIRRIPAASVKAGAVLDGEILATMGPDYTVDNMEGLAVRKGPAGETLLYVISDDNYSQFQRTILLMFELKDGARDHPRGR